MTQTPPPPPGVDEASVERFRRIFETPDATLGVLLRGHLLVEELLTDMLRAVSGSDALIEQARLSFAQKATLARALSLELRDAPVWHLVGALNVLRNDFAHNLTSDQREKKIHSFLTSLRAELSNPKLLDVVDTGPLEEQVALGVGFLLGALNSVAEIHRSSGRLLHATSQAREADSTKRSNQRL